MTLLYIFFGDNFIPSLNQVILGYGFPEITTQGSSIFCPTSPFTSVTVSPPLIVGFSEIITKSGITRKKNSWFTTLYLNCQKSDKAISFFRILTELSFIIIINKQKQKYWYFILHSWIVKINIREFFRILCFQSSYTQVAAPSPLENQVLPLINTLHFRGHQVYL